MENNEDPSVAFQREVLEESGCEIEIIEQLGVLSESEKGWKKELNLVS